MSEKKQRYLRTEFTWVDSPTYRRNMCACKGIEMVFNIIRKYAIRDYTTSKIWQKIFKEYYCKNILATSLTYEFILDKTGMNRKTLMKCLKILEDAGYIERKRMAFEDSWVPVFILGKRKPYVDNKNEPSYVDWWKVDDIVDREIMEEELRKAEEEENK